MKAAQNFERLCREECISNWDTRPLEPKYEALYMWSPWRGPKSVFPMDLRGMKKKNDIVQKFFEREKITTNYIPSDLTRAALHVGYSKYFQSPPQIAVYADVFAEAWTRMFSGVMYHELCDWDTVVSETDMSRSPGFPKNRAGFDTKMMLYDVNGAPVDKWEKCRSERTYEIWNSFGKDESLKSSKTVMVDGVPVLRTRQVTGCSFDYVMLLDRLILKANKRLVANWRNCVSGVGVRLTGGDWNALARSLMWPGKHIVFDFDVKQCDSVLEREIFRQLYLWRASHGNLSKENRDRLMILADELLESYVLMAGDLYSKWGGNCSGAPGTTYDNTLFVAALTVLGWVLSGRKSSDFFSKTKLKVYGDNGVVSTLDESFTFEEFQKALASVGIVVSSKSGTRTSVVGCEFLSHLFHDYHGYIVPVPVADSIDKMWCNLLYQTDDALVFGQAVASNLVRCAFEPHVWSQLSSLGLAWVHKHENLVGNDWLATRRILLASRVDHQKLFYNAEEQDVRAQELTACFKSVCEPQIFDVDAVVKKAQSRESMATRVNVNVKGRAGGARRSSLPARPRPRVVQFAVVRGRGRARSVPRGKPNRKKGGGKKAARKTRKGGRRKKKGVAIPSETKVKSNIEAAGAAAVACMGDPFYHEPIRWPDGVRQCVALKSENRITLIPVQDSVSAGVYYWGITIRPTIKNQCYTISSVANGAFTWAAQDDPRLTNYVANFSQMIGTAAGMRFFNDTAVLSQGGVIFSALLTGFTTAAGGTLPASFSELMNLKGITEHSAAYRNVETSGKMMHTWVPISWRAGTDNAGSTNLTRNCLTWADPAEVNVNDNMVIVVYKGIASQTWTSHTVVHYNAVPFGINMQNFETKQAIGAASGIECAVAKVQETAKGLGANDDTSFGAAARRTFGKINTAIELVESASEMFGNLFLNPAKRLPKDIQMYVWNMHEQACEQGRAECDPYRNWEFLYLLEHMANASSDATEMRIRVRRLQTAMEDAKSVRDAALTCGEDVLLPNDPESGELWLDYNGRYHPVKTSRPDVVAYGSKPTLPKAVVRDDHYQVVELPRAGAQPKSR